jgi:CRP-like cAMP-binding protein
MVKDDAVCGICQSTIKEKTLFSGLADMELDAFKDVVKMTCFRKKEIVFMEGDECLGLYVVRTGRVKLVRSSRSGKEQIIKILKPGELLGLEAFIEGARYGNSVECMEDSELGFILKEDFLRVLNKTPSIAVKLVTSLGIELSEAYDRIGNLGLMNAKEKMAHLLHTLASEYGTESRGEVTLTLALSRLEIAELLGITQETSIRLLKNFEKDGIIKIKRKEVVITSMEELATIGGVG